MTDLDRWRFDADVQERAACGRGSLDAPLFLSPSAGLAGFGVGVEVLGPLVAAFAGVREREEGAFLDALLLLLLFVGSGDGALTGEMEGEART